MRAMILGLTATLLGAGAAWAQAGDADYGRELLERRRCTSCHGGGGSAADLTKLPEGGYSPAGLAAAFWNHAPMMWQAFESRSLPVIGLSENDIANFYTYLYSLQFGEPTGDPQRGQRLFNQKGCAKCHAPKAGEDEKAGPPVERWSTMADSVLWLQEMWNHGAEMQQAMQAAGVEWPEFTAEEMADLVAYLETLPPHEGVFHYARLGDPATGERLFHEQGCAGCHVIRGEESGKVSLQGAASDPRLSALAATLWNHRPLMEKAGAEFQPFEIDQMADLATYLMREGYFPIQGNARRGGQVFESKQCGACHRAADSNAPNLDEIGPFSSVRMASAVWMHGRGMKAFMDYREQEWPQINEQEMADLVAYLNRGQ